MLLNSRQTTMMTLQQPPLFPNSPLKIKVKQTFNFMVIREENPTNPTLILEVKVEEEVEEDPNGKIEIASPTIIINQDKEGSLEDLRKEEESLTMIKVQLRREVLDQAEPLTKIMTDAIGVKKSVIMKGIVKKDERCSPT